ncbi:9847_t:CDS:2 [Diversispora eburnea]|uniref:9847_t:CDS:1 n=1 Tax=Diversispora eburnea TaxID=1213867 RepID=A0A9N9GB91_9GLOM|nr:9847_t:CDS:2 [Diversispora eburnea]
MANATQYLEENYPSSNRTSITNLDLSNKNFVGDLTISGFVNLQKLNYSFNNFNGEITLKNYQNLEDIDSSYINTYGSHNYDYMTKLKRLKLSNNLISSLILDGSKNLAYLECNSNSLTVLDLTNSENYVEVNCSNNPTLSEIKFPDSFDNVLFDCRDTSLTQVKFPNSSVFDSTATPTTNNHLSLKIGLSVGIISIFLLGLVTLLCYKYRNRRQGTSVLQIPSSGDGNRNQVSQNKEQEAQELKMSKRKI